MQNHPGNRRCECTIDNYNGAEQDSMSIAKDSSKTLKFPCLSHVDWDLSEVNLPGKPWMLFAVCWTDMAREEIALSQETSLCTTIVSWLLTDQRPGFWRQQDRTGPQSRLNVCVVGVK